MATQLGNTITTVPVLFVKRFKNFVRNILTALVKPLVALWAVSHIFFTILRKPTVTVYCYLLLSNWSCSSDHLRWKWYKFSVFNTLKKVWSHFTLVIPVYSVYKCIKPVATHAIACHA